ncbi:TIGR01244 family protein [Erythrobacter sp. QSSC1-22B]|uniref:TIGR01244 family sulfur transferase n=1 Tax=Erythrobacter sp. QSSC1-22B TaxID=1860125 RepID=UPI0008052C49|nr:TIGR01244 family sulfur transferase [Erythrobacter sp. QSSC1-22B]OBX19853.1 TIGR01244 family protein [Erythrobacter sp. QSSC1-22B]
MSEFRTLSDTVFAAGQIAPEDIARAETQGVTLIVNNRPDGEAPGQPDGESIEAAARAAGIDYVAIPVDSSGFDQGRIAAMQAALDNAEGKVLAYCRTGTRSTLLWALAEARGGRDPASIERAAAGAGYDLAPIHTALIELAEQAQK